VIMFSKLNKKNTYIYF